MSGRMIEVVSPGLLSTIQDAGRMGFQRYGVSMSGASDKNALIVGNRLTGNHPCAAAIEVTMTGAKFKMVGDTVAAITGANMSAVVNGVPAPMWTSFVAEDGNEIEFTNNICGARSYLCLAGSVTVPKVLGSLSTHLGSGIGHPPLAQGDLLPLGEPDNARPGLRLPDDLVPNYSDKAPIRTVPGPQETHFSSAGISTFYSSCYKMSPFSNRQGVRLEGPGIEPACESGGYDIKSDGVPPGSIQVTASGPIVLTADSQPTGGYSKIAVVASADMSNLVQKLPGEEVRFRRVTVQQAQELFATTRKRLLNVSLEPVKPFRVEFKVGNGGTEGRRIVVETPSGLNSDEGISQVNIDGIRRQIYVKS